MRRDFIANAQHPNGQPKVGRHNDGNFFRYNERGDLIDDYVLGEDSFRSSILPSIFEFILIPENNLNPEQRELFSNSKIQEMLNLELRTLGNTVQFYNAIFFFPDH